MFCHRTLSARKATISIRTLIDGESIELVADSLGVTRERAVAIRSQAFGEIVQQATAGVVVPP
jgi:hypothetical protein